MKPFYTWVILVFIALIFVFQPGELPCWLLEGTPLAHEHFHLGRKVVIEMTCPFSAIEANYSPAIQQETLPCDQLLAWLSRSLWTRNTQPLVLIDNDWSPNPHFPPPRTFFFLS